MLRTFGKPRRTGKAAPKAHHAPALSYFALERRTVFDGAAVATADDASHAAASQAGPEPPVADASHHDTGTDLAACLSNVAVDTKKTVAFVEATAGNNSALFRGVPAGADIVFLVPGHDTAGQIAEYLSRQPSTECVLVVSGNGVHDISPVAGQHDANPTQEVWDSEVAVIQ